MTQPAKTQEPSMEEILASIRRIIADDEAKPEAAAPTPAPHRRREPKLRRSPPPRTGCAAPPPPRACATAEACRGQARACAAASSPRTARTRSTRCSPASMRRRRPRKFARRLRTPPPADDVFELTEQMAVEDAKDAFQTIEPQNDIEFAEPPPEPPKPAAARVRGTGEAEGRGRGRRAGRPAADVAVRRWPRSTPPSTRSRRPC